MSSLTAKAQGKSAIWFFLSQLFMFHLALSLFILNLA